jgi:hypothetical protein
MTTSFDKDLRRARAALRDLQEAAARATDDADLHTPKWFADRT